MSVLSGVRSEAADSEHYGRVFFGAVPVPGATVIATQGDTRVVTSTDRDGVYRFPDLRDGQWSIRVEMTGFEPATLQIDLVANTPPSTWQLTLRALEAVAQETSTTAPANAFRRPPAVVSPPSTEADASSASEGGAITSVFGTADGLLINGSVNNAAATPFAQLRAFGNNRRGGQSRYTGGFGLVLGNAAWDATPYSFGGSDVLAPSYSDVHFVGSVRGPLKIPGLITNGPDTFIGVQRTSDHAATTTLAVMPTALERAGDFSQTRDRDGHPVVIVDPRTGAPFPGAIVPAERIAPQAASLLQHFPAPNTDGSDRFNYRLPTVSAIQQDAFQSRITQSLNVRTQVAGQLALQRTTTESTNVFGFTDTNRVAGIDAGLSWSYRYSRFLSFRGAYQFTHLGTKLTPHFASRTNVSADAGIIGNLQDPANWGPPQLIFTTVEALSDGTYSSERAQSHAWTGQSIMMRDRHTLTIGGELRRQHTNVVAQQNPRGSFSFSGDATGSDFADFLLGLAETRSIAYGNADKFFRGSSYAAYINDDWRPSAELTVVAGLRWEYESPVSELQGRLVNLDMQPGFTAAAPVVATNPVGPLTAAHYPRALVEPDRAGLQPRVGFSWRPFGASSLVIRGGYGVYRNTKLYLPLATLMAQQPPLSNVQSIQTTATDPITLEQGFAGESGVLAGSTMGRPLSNTFAVDPHFKVGIAQNWQVSAQRDLPGSLTILATYLGTKGSRLPQAIVPNTSPAGAEIECPSCPSGFVYVTSSGRSSRHAVQIELRRRLHNGFTATTRYTLAKALDDAAGVSGITLASMAIAQDWRQPEGEWGRSTFDQRHLFTAEVQYTTGVGVVGGTLVDGWKGRLLKGWTFTGQLSAGSGLPFTPVLLRPVTGTGVLGALRPDVIDATDPQDDGFYANPAAFRTPPPGHWGNAGRNSLSGPTQFSLNGGVTRTFSMTDRLSLDWRIDATNLLNRVTFASVNALVDHPQFGLPNRANSMRKLQTTLRLRF